MDLIFTLLFQSKLCSLQGVLPLPFQSSINGRTPKLPNRHKPAPPFPDTCCASTFIVNISLSLSTHQTMSNRDLLNNGHASQSSVFPFDRDFAGFSAMEGLVSRELPAVTVVLEGRCICQRICLHKHSNYESFARALRQIYVDISGEGFACSSQGFDFDLSNAIPGHFIAYEDMEDDLLLAGDLQWKDFIRVAKRIRILPAKIKNHHRKIFGAM